MSAGDSPTTRGVYVSPAAVVAAPGYARRLAREAGVNLFVLRTGFDPLSPDPLLDRGVETIHSLSARVCLLVGAWWGAGVNPAGDAMQPVCPWASYGPEWAYESHWTMRAPGGPADDDIERALRQLAARHAPHAVCLTHARFRHPADIPGLFETAPGDFEDRMTERGIAPASLRKAAHDIESALRGTTPADLARCASGKRLSEFLDDLAGAPICSRWLRFRCGVVEDSIGRFRAALQSVAPAVEFGSNAAGPLIAGLCGQRYRALLRRMDFLHPLLGYIRWHVLQPVGAWARFFAERAPGLGEEAAVSLSAALLGMEGLVLPRRLADFALAEEGLPESIAACVSRQIDLCMRAVPRKAVIAPVLRGREWPAEVIRRLSARIEEAGLGGVVYQGADFLAGPPPGPGWE
ncbi:MAG: hypothetical protein NTW86_14780 [Candidatus Sumerlaeota bacterium]|nr:hypothetical protein [Candidatus Sumerlaeota bacterium]